MFLSAPFEFSRLPEMLYGVNAPPSLSFDSCFFVSRPQEARARTKGQPFLNEEEASSLRLDDAEWNARPRVFRSLPAGPIIKVHEPLLREDENPTIETGTPLNLRITFEKNHAPVDMDSLEVTAKKGFFTLSITDRVRPYIHGTELAARTLDFPRGRFRIRLEIADVDGVVTSREYRLEVH
ncbi:MAG: hypothetical protein Kow0089_18920 [Desulfobulbaceae bacterium]